MKFTHPDYEPGEMLATQVANESPLFKQAFTSMCEDFKTETTSDFGTNELWLSTLSIGGKRYQAKLVITDTDFIDEN